MRLLFFLCLVPLSAIVCGSVGADQSLYDQIKPFEIERCDKLCIVAGGVSSDCARACQCFARELVVRLDFGEYMTLGQYPLNGSELAPLPMTDSIKSKLSEASTVCGVGFGSNEYLKK